MKAVSALSEALLFWGALLWPLIFTVVYLKVRASRIQKPVPFFFFSVSVCYIVPLVLQWLVAGWLGGLFARGTLPNRELEANLFFQSLPIVIPLALIGIPIAIVLLNARRFS